MPERDQETGNDQGLAELAGAADALFYAMRRARAAVGDGVDALSVAQVTLIEPLLSEEAQPVGRLATAASVSIPTATRMLKQLEARGILERQRSTTDERQVLISLTPHGTERLREVRARLRARQIRGLSEFGLAERTELAGQLRRLARIISDLNEAGQ
ncbi:MarR family winged helix-turn-helix transcriptional regulator [Streptomyces sp. NPDC048192]|uniref:MarR family winged helix-turn-helix transcriptional regulator n=1 Tax=Streptomyces sp. NPDC048192 TaxID=3365510 RepID=UPI0037170AA2